MVGILLREYIDITFASDGKYQFMSGVVENVVDISDAVEAGNGLSCFRIQSIELGG